MKASESRVYGHKRADFTAKIQRRHKAPRCARDDAFMRAAIIHYWLLNMRGGEKVLEAVCRLLPGLDAGWQFHRGAISIQQVWDSAQRVPWDAAELPHCFNALNECDP